MNKVSIYLDFYNMCDNITVHTVCTERRWKARFTSGWTTSGHLVTWKPTQAVTTRHHTVGAVGPIRTS